MKVTAGIAGAVLFAAMLAPTFADAKGSRSSSHSSHTSTHSSHSASHAKAAGVPRDSHGRIARSSSAKHVYEKSHPCPSTGKSSGPCPGYVVDHVTPLERGGADSPRNMQWQTTEAAKIKDRAE